MSDTETLGAHLAQTFLQDTHDGQRRLSAFLFCAEHSPALKALGADVIREIMLRYQRTYRLSDSFPGAVGQWVSFADAVRGILAAQIPRVPMRSRPLRWIFDGKSIVTYTNVTVTFRQAAVYTYHEDLLKGNILLDGKELEWDDMLCIVDPRNEHIVTLDTRARYGPAKRSETSCHRYADYCVRLLWASFSSTFPPQKRRRLD